MGGPYTRDELLTARALGPAAAAAGQPLPDYLRNQAAAAGISEPAVVDAALARAGVEVLLAPPTPPLVAIDAGALPPDGPPSAPVTIIELGDFQCPHTRRAEATLRRAMAAHGEQVRLVWRDLPRPVHREARGAAIAARCAAAQGRFWPYRDRLLQRPEAQQRAALVGHAGALGLDTARFTSCLDDAGPAAAVQRDADAAAALGARSTPTLFVNGRYVPPPLTDAALAAAIAEALGRAGVASASRASTPAPPPARIDASVRLQRAELARWLADRPALERPLEQGELDVDGRKLLIVSSVEPGSLYDRLGLSSRDVLMQVDGVWVTDASNPLWDALAGRDRVVLTIMRRGLPVHYEYRIE